MDFVVVILLQKLSHYFTELRPLDADLYSLAIDRLACPSHNVAGLDIWLHSYLVPNHLQSEYNCNNLITVNFATEIRTYKVLNVHEEKIHRY